MKNVNWIYCSKHFMIHVSQIILLYTSHLYTAICQLYVNKTGKQEILYVKKEKLSEKKHQIQSIKIWNLE